MKPPIEELKSAILLGDEKKACVIFLASLTANPEEFLQKARSKGVFRYANSAAKIETKARVLYNFKGFSGEIDVLAKGGNTLFAFECKNSLHPCSPFELRQSYDYLIKGFDQLTRFRTLILDPQFLELLGQKIAFKLENIERVITCVVTGNKMFSGYRHANHSVRCIHEICSFIGSGTHSTIVRDHKKLGLPKAGTFQMNYWKGTTFTPEDLADSLESDSLHEFIFRAMHEIHNTIPFGKTQLRFKTFVWDAGEHARNFADQPGVKFFEATDNSGN